MAPEQINGLAGRRARRRVRLRRAAVRVRVRRAPVRRVDRAGDRGARARERRAAAGVARRRAQPPGRRDRALPAERRRPDRFGSAAELARRARRRGRRRHAAAGPHATWWRAHQIVDRRCSTSSGATFAWQIKEWVETPVTVSIFLALGAAATIGGVLRGHLVFTAVMNAPRLTTERQRTRAARSGCSTSDARALLFADAAIVAGTRRAAGGVRARARPRHRARVARAGTGDHRRGVRRRNP